MLLAINLWRKSNVEFDIWSTKAESTLSQPLW